MSVIASILVGEPSPAKPNVATADNLFSQRRCRYIYLFFILIFAAKSAVAAPTIQITQPRYELDLTSYIDLFEDRQGSLAIEDIVSEHYSNQFSPLPPTALFFGYTRSVFWLRFIVENRLETAEQSVIEIMPADIDHVDLYGIDASGKRVLLEKRSGSAVNFENRDYYHHLYYFDIEVPAQSRRIFYVRLESNKNINARLHLSSLHEHFYRSGTRDWWGGVLAGGMVLLGLSHIGLGFVFKRKPFAYYGFSLLMAFILTASWNGYFVQFFNADVQLLDRQLMLAVYLSNVFFLLFVRSYLETHQRTPLMHRVLTAFIVLGLMGVPCSWLFDSTVNALLSGLYTLPSILLVFGLAVYSFMEGYEPARYFLLARTLTIVAILITVFSDYGLLPEGFLGASGISVAILLEGSIFLFAMTKQYVEKKRSDELARKPATNIEAPPPVPLSAFSHELRTPISGVLGMSELLLDTSLTDQQRLQVETIHQSGRSLMEVANKLSDLAAIESGDLRLNQNLFEISSVVESAVESARDAAERSHIELIYQIDEALSGFVKGDKEKLLQVLSHIMSLGMRRLQGGDLLLVARAGLQDRVSFDIITGKNAMEGSELFAQDSQPSLSSADNLNIGIARRFVDLMGGTLELQFTVEHGIKCQFAIALPRQLRQPVVFAGEQILRGKSLLVIDDNEACCKIIEQQATQWGMDVFTVTGSKEALALLRSHANMQRSFDILLVDYEMPGMNGLQLIHKIQQEKQSLLMRDAAFVILTGVSKMPTQLMQKHSNVSAVLYKPLSGKNLKAALIDVLQQKSAN